MIFVCLMRSFFSCRYCDKNDDGSHNTYTKEREVWSLPVSAFMVLLNHAEQLRAYAELTLELWQHQQRDADFQEKLTDGMYRMMDYKNHAFIVYE